MNTHARTFAAAVALSAGATLVLPVGSASAAAPPINGYVYASGEWTTAAGCAESSTGDVLQFKKIAPGITTVTSAETVTWDGAAPEEVTGSFATKTVGTAKSKNGAFDSFRMAGTAKVTLHNESADDCGITMWSVPFTSTDLKVKRKGKIRISWDHGAAGDLTDVVVSRDANVLVNKDPGARKGSLTLKAKPGTYGLYLRYQTGLSESAVAPGTEKTKKSSYAVTVKYLR